ncbi:MAG: regulatory protein RecX [Mixta calida]|uniref:Regulatory protein RecX n=1 Tax=Mixta calida TaxID=665913 RepID=A0ABM6S541_9GAMM|nr:MULTISPECIES: regulatory protein RecX [Mixta]AIX72764.1 RecX family transcriptional regulator [Pantoea sp. PSNIH2]MBS6058462.1 regulatory protein RecX [Pantoea sp.]POU52013.1 regulatory protein RecX [Pantoea sp. PSNIH5]POU63336.1 regulatory protein RecX [Pantoea sp. PSNIH4]POY69603.1 regulatory protein RecX [Pantoea sp. PSNIH3]HCW46067.1 regulatory protein RecX [Erwiniaceae bacterium]
MTDKPAKPVTFARLLDRATRILAMRDHSEAEFRRKIMQTAARAALRNEEQAEEIPAELLEQLVAWCYEHQWLDDVRFAQRFVVSRSRKGYGPQRIRMELTQKGIGRELAETALAEAEIDWSAQAFDVAERKFGLPLPTEWKEKARVQRYLQAKGFFMEDIQSIFRNYSD